MSDEEPKAVVHGRIYPHDIAMSQGIVLIDDFSVSILEPEPFEIDFHVKVFSDSFMCEVSGDIETYAKYAHNTPAYIEGLLDHLLNGYTFESGVPFFSRITNAIIDGQLITFPFGEQRLGTVPVQFENISRLHRAQSNKYLQGALSDYRFALLFRNDAAFFSYRVVERIKAYFSEEGETEPLKDKAAWKKMNDALKIDPEWTKEQLAEPAKLQRHGRHEYGSYEKKIVGLENAKLIVERFVLFLEHDGNLDELDDIEVIGQKDDA